MTEGERSTRRTLPWPVITAAAALGLVAVVVLGATRRPPIGDGRPLDPMAVVDALEGVPEALRGEHKRRLARGDNLHVGEELATGRGASLSMTTQPAQAVLVLAAESRAMLAGPAEIQLHAGKLHARVGDSTTVLVTPHGRVIAWRARVTVAARAAGTDVDVVGGFAHVEGPGGQRQKVPAGARMFLAARPPARD